MRQQPVLIDLSRALGIALEGRRFTGIDRVGQAYQEHFRKEARALVRFGGRWVVFGDTDSQRLFDWAISPDAGSRDRIRRLAGNNYVWNWQRPQKGSILLNTGHVGLDCPDYAERVRRYSLRPLYFLHDLIPIAFPEYAGPGEAETHRRRLRTMLTTAQGLIVNSAATGQELEDHAAHLGVSTPPWVTAHLAPPVFSAPELERPIPEPYFVVLGTIEPRKNHLLLLNLWRRLVQEFGRQIPKLVVIGQRGWECEQVLDMLERCEALNGVVVELNRCDDVALATWLHHAQALLFPSFAEGYGIPLVEALSLGTPVIVSDLPAFRELAGDIPEYLHPLDGEGWRTAVLEYATSESRRRSAQLARMAGWQSPGWSAHFDRVDAFIARCFGE